MSQRLHRDRGRPARSEHRKVRGSRKMLNFGRSVRAGLSCGRAARGPSGELEWSSRFNAVSCLSR
jgi:hypothetical protein